MNKSAMLTALTALFAATPVFAQSQADLNRRTSAGYHAADAAMTGQWKRTYAYMKGRDAQDISRGGGFGYAAALLGSQRAWLKYRDSECVIEGGQRAGGSAQGMVQGECRTRLTRERTMQLRGLTWK